MRSGEYSVTVNKITNVSTNPKLCHVHMTITMDNNTSYTGVIEVPVHKVHRISNCTIMDIYDTIFINYINHFTNKVIINIDAVLCGWIVKDSYLLVSDVSSQYFMDKGD